MAKEDAQYVRIQRSIWNKPRFRALSEDAQRLYLYIAICPHGNMTGLFVLRPGYALEDLQWEQSPERFTKGLRELLDSGHVKYDPKNKVILDLAQIVKFPLQNQNQVVGAISKLKELPFTQLLRDFKLLVKGLDKPLYKPLEQWLCQRLGNNEDEDVDVNEAVDVKVSPVDNSDIDQDYEAYLKKIKPLFDTALQIYPKLNIFLFLGNHKPHKGNEHAHYKAMEHTIRRLIDASSPIDNPYAYIEKVYVAELQNYNAQTEEEESKQFKGRGNVGQIFKGMGMGGGGGG